MNILFHCADYPPVASGVGSYVQNMAQALAAAGHSLTVVTARSPAARDGEGGHGVAIRRVYDRADLRKRDTVDAVLAIAREVRADFIEGADHLGECAPLLLRGPRPPVLIKAHSSNGLDVLNDSEAYYPWQRLSNFAGRMRVWPQCRAEMDSIRKADMLLAPSARMMSELERQGLSLPAKRAVVPNPIFLPSRSESRASPTPTILFVGRLNFGKGIHVLPGLLAHVIREFPDIQLEIAGPDGYAWGIGSTRKWMEIRFDSRLSHVKYHGALYGADLDAAYGRAWVVVVPSRWDNFPQVVLESMVRKRAVVASPYGGMPEMLAGTGNAIADLAGDAFAEATASFLRDPARREAAGISGFQRARACYAPEAVAKSYVAAVAEWIRGSTCG